MQTNLVKAGIRRFLMVIALAMVVNVALSSMAEAQQSAAGNRTGRFGFGAALGIHTDTPDGTALALGIYDDYYLTHEFSIGPLIQMGFTDDLFQVGLSAQAKFTFAVAGVPELKPHVQGGMGLIHADLDRRGREEDDTSYLIPLGIGAEYKLNNAVTLDNTFLFNFTDLDVRDENFFFTWLIGLKFQF